MRLERAVRVEGRSRNVRADHGDALGVRREVALLSSLVIPSLIDARLDVRVERGAFVVVRREDARPEGGLLPRPEALRVRPGWVPKQGGRPGTGAANDFLQLVPPSEQRVVPGAAVASALLLLHRRALGPADAQQQRPHLRSYVRRDPVARGAAQHARELALRDAPLAVDRAAPLAVAQGPAPAPRRRGSERAPTVAPMTPLPRRVRGGAEPERGDAEPQAGRRDDRGRRGARRATRPTGVVAAHARTRV